MENSMVFICDFLFLIRANYNNFNNLLIWTCRLRIKTVS